MAPYSGSSSDPAAPVRQPPALPVLTPSPLGFLAPLLGRSRQQLPARPGRGDIASATRSPRVPCWDQAGRISERSAILFLFCDFLAEDRSGLGSPGCAPRPERYLPAGRSALPAVPSGGPEQPHLNPCSLWQAYPGREREREGKAAASCRALVGRASCLRPRAAAAAGLSGGASCSGHPGRALPAQAAGPGLGRSRVSARETTLMPGLRGNSGERGGRGSALLAQAAVRVCNCTGLGPEMSGGPGVGTSCLRISSQRAQGCRDGCSTQTLGRARVQPAASLSVALRGSFLTTS